jgi:hypothetical protein
MTPHQKHLEHELLNYFCGLDTNGRRQILKDINVDYPKFMAAIRIVWDAEKSLPEEEQLTQRLQQVRAQVRAPRLGKKGRLFMLRHWPEARKLRAAGGSYQEISKYLQEYRRFQISTGYLKRLMENLT